MGKPGAPSPMQWARIPSPHPIAVAQCSSSVVGDLEIWPFCTFPQLLVPPSLPACFVVVLTAHSSEDVAWLPAECAQQASVFPSVCGILAGD